MFPSACYFKGNETAFVKSMNHFIIIFLLIKQFFVILDGSCRYLQREVCSSTYRIRIKIKLETIVHQNTVQIVVFEKNGEDKGIAV